MGNDTVSCTNISRDSMLDNLSDINHLSSKEPVDAYRNPKDPLGHVHLSDATKEPTAMPVRAISATDEDLIETIRTHLCANVDCAIDLDAGAWRRPRKPGLLHEMEGTRQNGCPV